MALALKCGCDGVWLIVMPQEHQLKSNADQLELLAACFVSVRCAFPDGWVGLNVLQLALAPALMLQWVMEHCGSANGLWDDDVHVVPASVHQFSQFGRFPSRSFPISIHEWCDIDHQLIAANALSARRTSGFQVATLTTHKLNTSS